MGRKKLDITEKKKPLTIKVDQALLDKIQANMIAAGYRCRSRYIRDLLDGKYIQTRRGRSAKAVQNKDISNVITQIKKIGTNYNQRVKILNTLYKKTRKNGDPVINTERLAYGENELERYTKELIKLARHLLEIYHAEAE